ncbi:MAG: hypothetical protein ACHQ17_09225 [Polyangia bacterium]|jgi:hypothetical protein
MADEPNDEFQLRLRVDRLEHTVSYLVSRLEALEKTVSGVELEVRQINRAEDLGVTP